MPNNHFLLAGRSYRMFDDKYVDFDNATDQCANLGAR